MSNPTSKLFNKAGYLALKDYVEDIRVMTQSGTWHLPLGYGDKVHLFILKVVVKFSWFSDLLFIFHPSLISPAYSILLRYLKKNLFFDFFVERELHHRGYFSYYFEKKLSIYGHPFVMSGQSVSEDRSTAFSIALGEMLERAISGMYDVNKDIIMMSPLEILNKYNVVYPPKYHRFLDVQKTKHKELNHNSNKQLAWVQGKNLITQEITYIPRQITSWFSENRNIQEIMINATTNGAAGYFTKDGALLRGILEVVQRDGFLVHWLTMIPPQLILQESLPADIQKKIYEFELLGISLYIMNITAIPIPSVLIAAINTHAETQQVVVSAGSALNFKEAIENALIEMVGSIEMFYFKAGTDILDSSSSANLRNFGKISRQLYWRGNNRVEEFKWFISGQVVPYYELCKQNILSDQDDSSKLAECLKVLKTLGEEYCPIAYYPKNKVQEKLGFFIAQIYIPKAFPFYLAEAYGTFDSERLREFAESKYISDWKLNPYPHMFS